MMIRVLDFFFEAPSLRNVTEPCIEQTELSASGPDTPTPDPS